MEPKIGIVICGFTENRQFVTNPYIQSVRYSKGLPIILPLVRSDRLISEYVKLCDGFLFCGGGNGRATAAGSVSLFLFLTLYGRIVNGT